SLAVRHWEEVRRSAAVRRPAKRPRRWNWQRSKRLPRLSLRRHETAPPAPERAHLPGPATPNEPQRSFRPCRRRDSAKIVGLATKRKPDSVNNASNFVNRFT